MADTVVLKKYANRRLYDTEQSAYVTLDEVADIIKAGKNIQALDAKSKEDVTEFILTQIILENARKKNALLPKPLLHMIIRYGDNVLGEFFEKYLELIIKNYLSYKNKVDDQYKMWLDFGMNMSEMSKQSMTGIPPFPFFNPSSTDKDGDQEK
ncbi:MAG: polyhydroxyalkanoate synthesis regulator DNA-binding domain-containing protein [Desulfobacterales bacterium]|nr:polyhydroxyalkanoate synthesis regulator DNA-binding domain-containing protein [Desulfobacterales bacterium]